MTATKRTSAKEPIHPKTQEPTNAARAARMAAALDAYRTAHDGQAEDDATILQDFVTDVCHLAHRRGVDVDEVIADALRMFWQELAQEGRS